MPHAADPVYGCWLWVGPRTRDGYGLDGRELAHKAAWRRVRGPLAPGLELDHLCRRRACVRPSHLEAVSRRENERRKYWRQRAAPRACARGHDFWRCCRRTPEGGYSCRACDSGGER